MSENEQVRLVFSEWGLENYDEFQLLVRRFSPNVDIQTKVMQLLNKFSNRLKLGAEIKTLYAELLQLYKKSKSRWMNCTIICIILGFSRLSPHEQAEIAPHIFSALKGKPVIHQDALMRLLVATFPHITLPDNPDLRMNLFSFEESPATLKRFLEFCLDVLIMPYSVISVSADPPVVAPGLSVYAVERLGGHFQEASWSVPQIEQFKIGILKMIAGGVFPEKDILIHLVVASSDTRDTVKNRADSELERRMGSLNWEDTTLNLMLYRLYFGDSQRHHYFRRKKPVDLRVKSKIVQNLKRSQAATKCFLFAMQLVNAALFAENTTEGLRVLGLEFVHHMCDGYSSDDVWQAWFIFFALLKTIQRFQNEQRTRGLAYTAMEKLAHVVPEWFSLDWELMQDAFQALTQEFSQGNADCVQNSLHMIALAHQNVPSEHLPFVEAVISKYITDRDHLCRWSSVKCAEKIISSDHVSLRYLLLLAVSDDNKDVANEARQLFDRDINFPRFAEMLKFVYDKAEQRLGSQSILFPLPTFLIMLQYLRKCLLNDASEILPEEEMEASVIAEYIRNQLGSNRVEMTMLISKYVRLISRFANDVTDSYLPEVSENVATELFTINNLTALRVVEQIFRTLLKTVDDGIMEVDQENWNIIQGGLLNLENSGFIDAICQYLENVRYQEMSEEALTISQLLHQLFAAKLFVKAGSFRLISCLASSPFAEEGSRKKDSVDELFRNLESLWFLFQK